MTPEELQRHSKVIDESVVWIQQRTEDVWSRYELIDDCYSQECEEEKLSLLSQMDGYITKLQGEEKRIDKYEEILHNTTGTK